MKILEICPLCYLENHDYFSFKNKEQRYIVIFKSDQKIIYKSIVSGIIYTSNYYNTNFKFLVNIYNYGNS